MNRAVLLPVLFAIGCTESRAIEAEGRAADAKAAADQYNERELKPVDQAVHALRAELVEHQGAAATAERELRSLQQALARSWGGDPNTLRARIGAAQVRPDLVPFLEEAQKTAGAATVERRFGDAVKQEALDEVAAILAGWESARYGPGNGEDARPPAQECERTRLELECASLASDEQPPPPRYLCGTKDRSATFVVSVEDSAVRARRVEPEVRGTARIVRTLGRDDWWMLRREHTEPVDGTSLDRGARASSRAWVGFLRLGAEAATERFAVALEGSDKPVTFAAADVDADGAEEIVVVGSEVRAVHYSPLTRDLELWTAQETCSRIATRSEAALADAKSRCAQVQPK